MVELLVAPKGLRPFLYTLGVDGSFTDNSDLFPLRPRDGGFLPQSPNQDPSDL